jgi:hypothetical protein
VIKELLVSPSWRMTDGYDRIRNKYITESTVCKMVWYQRYDRIRNKYITTGQYEVQFVRWYGISVMTELEISRLVLAYL